METKQTTVEWLISEIQRYNDSGYEFHPKYNEEIIEQAKQMEKQQIIKAAASAYEDMFGSDGTKYGEEYYNNTFKKK